MPPLVISSIAKAALAVLGAAAFVRWTMKEFRRINADLERVKASSLDPAARRSLPTLRRDPRSGEWRLM